MQKKRNKTCLPAGRERGDCFLLSIPAAKIGGGNSKRLNSFRWTGVKADGSPCVEDSMPIAAIKTITKKAFSAANFSSSLLKRIDFSFAHVKEKKQDQVRQKTIRSTC
jgi:hypothetical protein